MRIDRFRFCWNPYPTLPVAMALLVATVASQAALVAAEDAAVRPLRQAHAHNDYLHDRPLVDALSHGFTSVEADVFLIDGELLVAHTRREIRPDRSLKRLYLDPLRERTRSAGGSIHGDGKPFFLLIDIKSDAEATYAALHETLADYADVVTTHRDGQVNRRAIDVVISGNRPIDTIVAQSQRYAGIDGRLGDLDSELSSDVLPLISDRWGAHFRWRGTGPIDDAESTRLREIVSRAHAAGRRVRFWATPETESAWRLLHQVGVDHINTDDLAGLAAFLRQTDR